MMSNSYWLKDASIKATSKGASLSYPEVAWCKKKKKKSAVQTRRVGLLDKGDPFSLAGANLTCTKLVDRQGGFNTTITKIWQVATIPAVGWINGNLNKINF